jgi:hypothetical protein
MSTGVNNTTVKKWVVESSCEHGNEPSDSIRGGKFLSQLSNYQFLRGTLFYDCTTHHLRQFGGWVMAIKSFDFAFPDGRHINGKANLKEAPVTLS